MDNRLNEIRKKISAFRGEMRVVETEMRGHIAHDRDCSAAGSRLLAMRKDLALMIEEFTALGGAVPLPTVNERLKRSRRHTLKAKPLKLVPPPSAKLRKRRLASQFNCAFEVVQR
jgi:hypothetical protein